MRIFAIKTAITWLFSLESWQKRLVLQGFDSIVIPMSVLLALTSRLSLEFDRNRHLYRMLLTYGCTMSIFFTRNFYKSFTRHVTIDTAITIILASFVSAFVLFNFIILALLKFLFQCTFYSSHLFDCVYYQPPIF